MQLMQEQEKRIEYLLNSFEKNPVVEDRYTKKPYDDFDQISEGKWGQGAF